MEIYTNTSVDISPQEIADVIEPDELAALLNRIVVMATFTGDDLGETSRLKKETVDWLKLAIKAWEDDNT